MNSELPVLVCFAVPQEAARFRKRTRGGQSIVTVVTGMGANNASMAIRNAVEAQRPQAVITAGFAGGLDPALPTGTVVADFSDWPALRPTASASQPVQPVETTFHCADTIAVTPEQKRALRDSSGAGAVEMESGIIRQFCREQGLPSATVRVISDASDESLPLNFNQLTTSAMKMNYAKLLCRLAARPDKIGELMRFQKRLREAEIRLAEVLVSLLAGAGIGDYSRAEKS